VPHWRSTPRSGSADNLPDFCLDFIWQVERNPIVFTRQAVEEEERGYGEEDIPRK
jgi:hypothetical protein